ncbi:MAG: LysR family transcriptional regulator [Burkholderiales bacterium]|nr:LysR family transcriptional regulator [Burkholderiales bacterium]
MAAHSSLPVPAAPGPFDLNLRHLRGLVAVCEHGSISAAARVLNLSQPALTQGISKLETQVGRPLFERRAGGMRPNSAGEIMAPRARAVIEHLAVAGRRVAGAASYAERRVTMAQLRAFLAVAQAGSFAGAAQRTGLSETAVNRAVRELEALLGKPLLERRGRGVSVNFVGRRFARACRLVSGEILAAFSELELGTHAATIAVGTTPLARAFLVPEAMATMAAMGGGEYAAGFQVLEGSWGELVETLRDGAIDLVVGELPPHDSPDLLKTPLCQEPLVIVAGSQHPLVGRRRPSLATLASYPWIIGPENSPLRSEWERLFTGMERPPAPIECGSIMIVGRLLTSTTLLTLATPDQVALQIRSGLLGCVGPPLEGTHHTIGMTLRRGWRPTPLQQRFLDQLAQAAQRIDRPGEERPGMARQWN